MRSTVADVLTRRVVTATPSTPFREAVRLLAEHRVHALPVVDDDRRPVGIVSECDLLMKEELQPDGRRGGLLGLLRRRDRARARARTVTDAMSSPVATVEQDATLQSAAHLLRRRGVGRLVVVDDDGRLSGILTRSDLLRVFLCSDSELEADVAEVLAACGARVGEVTPEAHHGVVVLRGEVDLTSRTDLIMRRVRAVPGVVDVEDRIVCRHDDLHMAAFGF